MREVIDARGPTSWNATPEGRKLRAKILAQVEAGMRRKNALDMGPTEQSRLWEYGKLLGLSAVEVAARINAQNEALAMFVPAPPPRRVTNARGPTDWNRDAEGKRLRASLFAAIDRRTKGGWAAMSKAERRLYGNERDEVRR